MWLKIGLLVALTVCISSASASFVTYDGYKVYDILQKNIEEIEFLHSLNVGNNDLDFWRLSKIVGEHARVMVSPVKQDDFETVLTDNHIEFTYHIDNVQRDLDQEQFVASLRPTRKNVTDSYYRHNEVNQYLDELAAKYPKFVKVQVVGKSYEGREMKTITITNGDGQNKSTVFLDAGIHAREWIAPATALYVINQLVENANQHQDLLRNLTFVILPVVNPDGYEHTHVRDRFWRKTRSMGKLCIGTDGNRNFDFHWGEIGASPNECLETYRGPNAFSEIETQVVKNVLRQLNTTCKFYLTLHSYGNYLLYPWGYTSDLPATWKDLDNVAQAGATAIRNYSGARYTVGSSTNVLYAAAGGSDDYALGVMRVPISITMELPAGGSGFDPPAYQIKRSVEESFVGIKAMALHVAKKY